MIGKIEAERKKTFYCSPSEYLQQNDQVLLKRKIRAESLYLYS